MGWKPTLDQRSLTPPGVWLGRIGMVNFGTKVTINDNNRVHLHQWKLNFPKNVSSITIATFNVFGMSSPATGIQPFSEVSRWWWAQAAPSACRTRRASSSRPRPSRRCSSFRQSWEEVKMWTILLIFLDHLIIGEGISMFSDRVQQLWSCNLAKWNLITCLILEMPHPPFPISFWKYLSFCRMGSTKKAVLSSSIIRIAFQQSFTFP